MESPVAYAPHKIEAGEGTEHGFRFVLLRHAGCGSQQGLSKINQPQRRLNSHTRNAARSNFLSFTIDDLRLTGGRGLETP